MAVVSIMAFDIAFVDAPASMGHPLVLVRLPWCLALSDEALLVLLGCVPCSPYWFVVEVVLWITVDPFKSCSSLLIDLQVVLVQGLLPVLCLPVIQCGGSFIGSQGGISLPPP